MQGSSFDLVQEHVFESGLQIDRLTDISGDLLTGTLPTLPWTRLGLATEFLSSRAYLGEKRGIFVTA